MTITLTSYLDGYRTYSQRAKIAYGLLTGYIFIYTPERSCYICKQDLSGKRCEIKSLLITSSILLHFDFPSI
jgi:hypothetical protein